MMSFFDNRKGLEREELHFEWQFSADEAEWARRLSQQEPLTATVKQGNARLLLATGALLLLLATAGGWLWHSSQMGLATVKRELNDAVAAEVWAAAHDYKLNNGVAAEIWANTLDYDVFRTRLSALSAKSGVPHEDVREIEILKSLQDPLSGNNLPITDIELLQLDGDIAVVEAVIQLAADGPAYRQTRVYHYGNNGWRRAVPAATHWQPRQMESTYFVFHYYTLDAGALVEAAARLDVLYPTLYASFFIHAPGEEKLAIYIEPMPASSLPWTNTEGHESSIAIPSLSLHLVPVAISDADALTEAILMALLDDLVSQAKAAYGDRFRDHLLAGDDDRLMQHLLDGVLLWQLWASDLPLAAWREPVVQWVYSKDGELDKQFEVATTGPDPCALSRLWLAPPPNAQNLFLCDGQIRVERSIPWRLLYPPPVELDDILLPAASNNAHPAIAVAWATLIEYAAESYGRQRIPMLISSYGEHERWDTLIPAVFGIGAVEFERGWQEYLADQYKVELNF